MPGYLMPARRTGHSAATAGRRYRIGSTATNRVASDCARPLKVEAHEPSRSANRSDRREAAERLERWQLLAMIVRIIFVILEPLLDHAFGGNGRPLI